MQANLTILTYLNYVCVYSKTISVEIYTVLSDPFIITWIIDFTFTFFFAASNARVHRHKRAYIQ